MGSSLCSSSKGKQTKKDQAETDNLQQEGQQPEEILEEKAKQAAFEEQEQYMDNFRNSSSMRKKSTVESGGNQQKRYKKGGIIHQSSRGNIYQGVDLLTSEPVCIKDIQFIGQEKQVTKAKSAINKYVQNLKNLNHPNIVQYLDAVDEISEIQVIFEFLNNGSLKTYLSEKGTLGEEETAMFARSILEGLRYLHQSSLLHKNLKAANVMLLSDYEQIKISNLEITPLSDVLKKNQVKVTEIPYDSQNPGSLPNWQAPEVITKGVYSFKSDIWSFGCVIIELLTGMPPYPGLAPSKVSEWLSYGVRPQFPVKFTQECEEFLESCLQIDPEKRLNIEELLTLPFLQQKYNSQEINNNNNNSIIREKQKLQAQRNTQKDQYPLENLQSQQQKQSPPQQVDQLSQFSEEIPNQDSNQEVDMKMRWKKTPTGEYIIQTVSTVRPDYNKEPDNNNREFRSQQPENIRNEQKTKAVKNLNATPPAQQQSRQNFDRNMSDMSINSQQQQQKLPYGSYPSNLQQAAPRELSNQASNNSLSRYQNPSLVFSTQDKWTQHPEIQPSSSIQKNQTKPKQSTKRSQKVSSSPHLKSKSKIESSPRETTSKNKNATQRKPEKVYKNEFPSPSSSSPRYSEKNAPLEKDYPLEHTNEDQNVPNNVNQVYQTSIDNMDDTVPKSQYIVYKRRISMPSDYQNQEQKLIEELHKVQQPRMNQWIPLDSSTQFKLVQEGDTSDGSQQQLRKSQGEFQAFTAENSVQKEQRYQPNNSSNSNNTNRYQPKNTSPDSLNNKYYNQSQQNADYQAEQMQKSNFQHTTLSTEPPCDEYNDMTKNTINTRSINNNDNSMNYKNRLPYYQDEHSKKEINTVVSKKEKEQIRRYSDEMAIEKQKKYEQWQKALQKELDLQEQKYQQ